MSPFCDVLHGAYLVDGDSKRRPELYLYFMTTQDFGVKHDPKRKQVCKTLDTRYGILINIYNR